jgi:hypothetical protein
MKLATWVSMRLDCLGSRESHCSCISAKKAVLKLYMVGIACISTLLNIVFTLFRLRV